MTACNSHAQPCCIFPQTADAPVEADAPPLLLLLLLLPLELLLLLLGVDDEPLEDEPDEPDGRPLPEVTGTSWNELLLGDGGGGDADELELDPLGGGGDGLDLLDPLGEGGGGEGDGDGLEVELELELELELLGGGGGGGGGGELLPLPLDDDPDDDPMCEQHTQQHAPLECLTCLLLGQSFMLSLHAARIMQSQQQQCRGVCIFMAWFIMKQVAGIWKSLRTPLARHSRKLEADESRQRAHSNGIIPMPAAQAPARSPAIACMM